MAILWLALVVTFTCSPVYSVLSMGQATPWVVLGIAAVLLNWEGKLNIWFAGAGLVLIPIKPQIYNLLKPALILWVITQRKWKFLISAAVIGVMSILVIMLVNTQVFYQYFAALQDYPVDQWATPTIGSYLRLLWLGVDKFWVQYLPALFGLIWLFLHFWKRRRSWREQIPLLSIVSLLTTPYAWTNDAIIILPAILVATSRLSNQNKTIKITLWSTYLAINLCNLLLPTHLNDF